MADRQLRRWTSAEDQILRDQVDTQQAQGVGRDWCQVASALPGRSNKDCRKRWHNSVAEGLRKGQWSKSEDQSLTHGVHLYASQWTKVATCVDTRSADQCAKRWQQSLDPRLDRSEWRKNEDDDLLAAVERLGRHWKDIQEQYLPHRSKNCAKNRYAVLARRNATQTIPYDDSVEGSSSDPDTPLLFGSTSAPPLYNLTQTSYEGAQYLYASDHGMMPTWSEIRDPNELLAAGYPGSSTHPSFYPIQVLLSNEDDWSYTHAAVDMQQSLQYPIAPPMQFHTHAFPAQQQPQSPTARTYAISMAQASNHYVSSAGSTRQPPQQGRHGRYQEDSAPLGWPEQ